MSAPALLARRQETSWQRVVSATVPRLLVLAAALILIGVPLWMLLVNSVKPLSEAGLLGMGLPQHWAVAQNYQTVIDQGLFWQDFRNSLLTDIPPIVLTVLLAAMAAWVFARACTYTVRALYFATIVGMLIPGAIVPTVLWLQQLHLYGGRVGITASYVGSFLPFVIFLLTGFVKTIPFELEEAARLEGAGSATIFWRIILPLLKPFLASAAIILLLGFWNDFFTPFFLLPNPTDQTLPMGLFNFSNTGQYQMNWNLIFADVVLTSLPLVAVYVSAQRWIVAGLTLGAIKG